MWRGKKRDNHFLSQEVLIRLKDQQGARGVLLSSCVLPPGSAARGSLPRGKTPGALGGLHGVERRSGCKVPLVKVHVTCFPALTGRGGYGAVAQRCG